MSLDSLRHLSREECVGLLERRRLGRVSVSIGALPAILPVSYAVCDDTIVFRTAPGTKLSAAVMGTVVGFEVDDATEDLSSGWSVLVVGHASEIRDVETLDRVRELALASWAPGERDSFVRITTEQVSGRAFGDSAVTR